MRQSNSSATKLELSNETPPVKKLRLPSELVRLLKIPLSCFGIIVIIVVTLCAIFAPWISPYNPTFADTDASLAPPSQAHLLGTDQLGRDVLSRLIYGARVALIVSVGAISLSILIGAPIGLFSAYAGGWLDEVLMRIMDGLVSFPGLLIAIVLVGLMGANLLNVIIAVGLANIPWIARIMRSQALSVRERDYVVAARSIGAKTWRIIGRHMWPNCTAPLIVQATLGMAGAILTEAALGFLGLSVQPPTPTWGRELQFAFPLLARAPLLCIAPGVAIFLLVLAFNFVGDALRDVLDPRLRGLIR